MGNGLDLTPAPPPSGGGTTTAPNTQAQLKKCIKKAKKKFKDDKAKRKKAIKKCKKSSADQLEGAETAMDGRTHSRTGGNSTGAHRDGQPICIQVSLRGRAP